MSFANNAAIASTRSGFGTRELSRVEGASEDVLAILEAASDLGDDETIEACHRIIEANKIGAPISQADMRLMLTYFR
jgi:hypothetical protein